MDIRFSSALPLRKTSGYTESKRAPSRELGAHKEHLCEAMPTGTGLECVFSNSRKACFLGLTETMELFHHLFRLRKQGWTVTTALVQSPGPLKSGDVLFWMHQAMSSNEQKMQILNESWILTSNFLSAPGSLVVSRCPFYRFFLTHGNRAPQLYSNPLREREASILAVVCLSPYCP